jgi:hypothetical protein
VLANGSRCSVAYFAEGKMSMLVGGIIQTVVMGIHPLR